MRKVVAKLLEPSENHAKPREGIRRRPYNIKAERAVGYGHLRYDGDEEASGEVIKQRIAQLVKYLNFLHIFRVQFCSLDLRIY